MSVLRYSNLFVHCIGLLYIAAIYSTGVGLAQAVECWTFIKPGGPGSIPLYCYSFSVAVIVIPIDSIIDRTNLHMVVLRWLKHC